MNIGTLKLELMDYIKEAKNIKPESKDQILLDSFDTPSLFSNRIQFNFLNLFYIALLFPEFDYFLKAKNRHLLVNEVLFGDSCVF